MDPQQSQQNSLQNNSGSNNNNNTTQSSAGPGAFSNVRLAFIIDTSVSMAQRTPNGMSLLDVAKMAADPIVSSLCRQGGGHGRPQVDRCVLFNGRGELVTGLGDTFSLFTKSLMHLEVEGKADLGRAIAEVMDAINIQRGGSNGDTFMRGRCPWKSVPWAVILITDHSACTNFAPAPTRLLPDTEFVDGLFRWDQRLHALVLGVPCVLGGGGGATNSAQPFMDGIPDCPTFTRYCTDTGGSCTLLRSVAHVNAAADALVNSVRTGVSVRVSCAKGDMDLGTQVFNPTSSILYWPFPEDSWIEYSVLTSLGSIPKRGPQPRIVLYPGGDCPRIPEKLPADRYELENSSLTEMLRPGACFVACIAGANDPYRGSFGFLTLSETKKGCVVLIVLLPGFQRLLRLIEENQEKSPDWRRRLGEYIKELPLYYHEYLGKALKYIGIYNALQDRSDRLIRPDKVDSQVIARRSKAAEKLHFNPGSIVNLNGPPSAQVLAKSRTDDALGSELGLTGGRLKIALTPRVQLLQEVSLLRNRLFFAGKEEGDVDDQKHRAPISRMGNFEEYLKRKNDLRPVTLNEESPYRKQLFGNPFKKIKFVDEADNVSTSINLNKNEQNQQNISCPFPTSSSITSPPTKSLPPSSRSVLSAKRKESMEQPWKKADPDDVKGFYHNSSQRLQLYRIIRGGGDPEELRKALDGLQGSSLVRIELAKDLVELAKACCPGSLMHTVAECYMKRLYESKI